MDMGIDHPRTCHITKGSKILGTVFGKPATIFTGTHPNHRKALNQGNIRREARDTAARKAHNQQSSAKCDAASGHIEDVSADRIEYDVGSASCQNLDLVLESCTRFDHRFGLKQPLNLSELVRGCG